MKYLLLSNGISSSWTSLLFNEVRFLYTDVLNTVYYQLVFTVGLRTKKPLLYEILVTQTGFNLALNFSGPANEWYDTFQPYFSYSQTIRQRFSKNVLL